PTHMTTEVRRAGCCRNERPCLQDPRTGRVFRKKHRGCHSECDCPRIKNHSLYEVVRSGANERPHRGWIGAPLPGHLAGGIYPGGVIPGAGLRSEWTSAITSSSTC